MWLLSLLVLLLLSGRVNDDFTGLGELLFVSSTLSPEVVMPFCVALSISETGWLQGDDGACSTISVKDCVVGVSVAGV